MEKREPTRPRYLDELDEYEDSFDESIDADATCSENEHAIRFLLNSINATIFSSGEDYDGALDEFFPQIQALGHLVGARSLDEVSSFLRDRRHW